MCGAMVLGITTPFMLKDIVHNDTCHKGIIHFIVLDMKITTTAA